MMGRHRGRRAASLALAFVLGCLSLSAAADPARRPVSTGADARVAGCMDPSRTFVHTPRGILTGNYSPSTDDDTTFLASLSTWEPNLSTYPIGIDDGSRRICWMDGKVLGSIPAHMTWEEAHAYNQPCARIVAKDHMTVDGLRCDNTDDGFRPRETSVGAQNVTMTVRDTYFTRMHDDCLENDGVIGGLLQDSLWDGCNTGISEQPDGGTFSQPAGEKLVLDHMLIGLWVTPHEGGPGENSLFKWSNSANDVVIKCSVFKVDRRSLNGASAMAIPGRVDDSGCHRHPTRLVWLGAGHYPGSLPPGIQVVTERRVWTRAVQTWRCAHGYLTSC